MRRLPKLEGEIKLDIGCGKYKKNGYIGMDKREYNQEILWDINHGFPFPNDSVDEIYTSHTVEHLREHEIQNFIT